MSRVFSPSLLSKSRTFVNYLSNSNAPKAMLHKRDISTVVTWDVIPPHLRSELKDSIESQNRFYDMDNPPQIRYPWDMYGMLDRDLSLSEELKLTAEKSDDVIDVSVATHGTPMGTIALRRGNILHPTWISHKLRGYSQLPIKIKVRGCMVGAQIGNEDGNNHNEEVYRGETPNKCSFLLSDDEITYSMFLFDELSKEIREGRWNMDCDVEFLHEMVSSPRTIKLINRPGDSKDMMIAVRKGLELDKPVTLDDVKDFIRSGMYEFRQECVGFFPERKAILDSTIKRLERRFTREYLKNFFTRSFVHSVYDNDKTSELECYARSNIVEVRSISPVDGYSLLHIAAVRGKAHIIDFLVRHHMNVNDKSFDNIPLLMASAVGNEEAVGSLIQCGADVNVIDNYGKMAIFYAAKHINIVKILVEAGADLEHQDLQGKTPLLEAIDVGNTEVVDFLVKSGANANRKDEDHGRTPIFFAVFKRNIEICETLIKSGVDVNSKDKYGDPLIFYAISYKDQDMLALLLKFNPDLKGNGTLSVLEYAKENGDEKIVKMIEDHQRPFNVITSKIGETYSKLCDKVQGR